jgi:hypothetical protein
MTALTVEMCANCCKPADRCTCRLVSVPVTLEATLEVTS